MNCRYCGQSDFDNGKCMRCGAQKPGEEQARDRLSDEAPGFAWNGHWVIVDSADDFGDLRRYRFYLGPQLMAVIPIDRRLLQELLGKPEDYSTTWHSKVMAFIWELYLVAVGEQREYVLEWKNRNSLIRPANYVITRAPDDPDKEYPELGLRYGDLVALRDRVLTQKEK